MKNVNVLAMDYGASNGRCMLGSFDGSKLAIKEIHRFPNNLVTCNKGMYWDILAMFNELKNGLAKAKTIPDPIKSIGIDTWALDFGVLDAQGNLIGNPHSYRDSRVNEVADEVFKALPEYEIFSKTGMIPATIFTLFQIVSMKYKEKAFLEKGEAFLFMPNLLSYFLTGSKSCDSTQASTSLLYSPFIKNWIDEFPAKLGFPNLFPEIKPTGSVIGTISKSIAEETGIGEIPVVSVASHDTASAIAAVPAENKCNVIYISCGTWSVVGTTLQEPLVDREAMEQGFNNEIGYDDEIMFVKNNTGLWILQECVREWKAENYSVDYAWLEESARKSAFNSFIDVNSPEFAQPGSMNKKVAEYCSRTGQQMPENKEEVYKAIVSGLAHKHAEVIGQIKRLTGRKYNQINIIGGGSRDTYLCELTARFSGMDVLAGPYEATAIGNIMAQLIALGEISNRNDAVEIIKKSFPLNHYRT